MKKTIALAILAMGTAQFSHAAPVTVNFSAVVTITGNGLPAVGSLIEGTVTFGDVPSSIELPPPSACSPFIACAGYEFNTAPSQFAVNLGGTEITSSMVGVGMASISGPPMDMVSLGTKVNGVSYFLYFMGTSASSFSVANLSDASAFISQWRPGDTQFSSFAVYNAASEFEPSLHAQITGFSVTSVPEPTSVALFALGLGGVALASRRRASPAHQAMNDA